MNWHDLNPYPRRNDSGFDAEDVTNLTLTTVGSFAVGAALMYLLDPGRGTRRRHVIRDKAFSGLRGTGEGLGRTAQSLRNSARGLVAETHARFRKETPSDYKIGARVRSAMGRVVSHPSAILVTVIDGSVTLCGDVRADELPALLAAARNVRGVREVHNQLNVHEDPTGVPSLQGEGKQRREGPQHWSPASRLLVGAAGGVMGAYGVVRRDWLGAGLGLMGLGLMARGMSSLPTRRLIGVGAGRDAVRVQKTVNIDAPVGAVFGFFSRYDNFPRFMSNVREVHDYGTGYSHWVVAGPAGVTVEWDAELCDFDPHRCIAWQSVPGSTVENEGVLRFQENPDGTTRVDVHLSYNPPAGALGHLVAKLFGSDPKSEMDQDLARVKTLIETGNPPRDAAKPLASTVAR